MMTTRASDPKAGTSLPTPVDRARHTSAGLQHLDAEPIGHLTPRRLVWCLPQLAEVFLDTAGRRDQQNPYRLSHGCKRVRHVPRKEHEAPGRRLERLVATTHDD